MTSLDILRAWKKDHEKAEELSHKWDAAEIWWCRSCGTLLTIHGDMRDGFNIDHTDDGPEFTHCKG